MRCFLRSACSDRASSPFSTGELILSTPTTPCSQAMRELQHKILSHFLGSIEALQVYRTRVLSLQGYVTPPVAKDVIGSTALAKLSSD